MNSIIKGAIGVALLGAVSVPAFATSVTPPASGPTPVPGLTNGGLIVEVWDTVSGTSMSEWLGGDYGTVGPTSAAAGTLDYGVLGGSSTFNSLFSSSEIAAGNVNFMVTAVNDVKPSQPQAAVTVASIGTVTGNALGTFSSSINTGIAAIMNGVTACNNVNPCTATSTGSPGYAANYLGVSSIGGASTAGTAGGAALDFYNLANTTGSAKNPVQTTQYLSATGGGAATWTLSATGDLVYAVPGVSAVPLPAAVWLLGSGLLGLAGIGRRKMRAA